MTRSLRLVAALPFSLAVLAGCSGAPPATETSSLTYYKDVKPLVEDKCLQCHYDGGIAPFALDSYEAVAAHKAEINVAVANRVMPPWLAGKGCADYAYDRSLSDDQIKMVTGWLAAGMKKGDPAEYHAAVPSPKSKLSRVDSHLPMPTQYTPQISPDDYRCFLIDWPETAVKYVSGFRANPGNPAIVHHVIAFLAPPAEVANYQKLDDADPLPGYTCFGGPGNGGQNAQWLGAWAPGSEGTDFVPNTGVKVQPGSKVILQVHYNTFSTAAAPDLTTLDFKLDDTVQKEAVVQPWTNIQWVQNKTMNIPAGAPDTMHNYSFDPTPYMGLITNNVIAPDQPFTIWSASLHMHTRGTHARLDIVHADQSKECMLDIPRWDFHWQGAYGFTAPMTFKPGDQLYLECHWDNSVGTTELNWGEGTGDEMCLGGFYITQ
jgi:hypothetical protein